MPFGPGENTTFIANDWHSALIPVMLKTIYKPNGQFTEAKCAFCVHNIAFQGRFWADSFGELALPGSSKQMFEFTDGYPKIFDELAPASEDEITPAKGGKFDKINWM